MPKFIDDPVRDDWAKRNGVIGSIVPVAASATIVEAAAAVAADQAVAALYKSTAAGAINVTVPQDLTTDQVPIGGKFSVLQYGAGQVTLVAGGTVTIRARVGLKTAAQYGIVTLTRIATNEYVLTGDAAA